MFHVDNEDGQSVGVVFIITRKQQLTVSILRSSILGVILSVPEVASAHAELETHRTRRKRREVAAICNNCFHFLCWTSIWRSACINDPFGLQLFFSILNLEI